MEDDIKKINNDISRLKKAILMVEDARYKHTKNIYKSLIDVLGILSDYSKILQKDMNRAKVKKLNKNIKEIENIISAGVRGDFIGMPLWLSFTRKEKRIKK